MAADHFAVRRDKLLKLLKKQADAILVTNFTNVSYLTSFSGDSSYLLLGKNVSILISDTRYTIQIQEECPGLEFTIRDSKEPMTEAVSKVLKKAAIGSLGYESSSLTVETFNSLKEKISTAVPGLNWVPCPMAVEGLREIKDKVEIEEHRLAAKLAQRGFEYFKANLTPEQTERQAAFDLEHAMRKFGADSVAFEPIIAVGPRAALPHARPTDQQMNADDFVLIDWGAKTRKGYRSDLTRVLVTGKITSKYEKIYDIVLRAQKAGIEAIRPGVKCSEVDRIARSVIEEAGHGKNFGHGLGHGIGRDIHEQPRFSALSDQVLQPGMIVTVEPGIYLAGWGGIRIEDDVLVTKDGHEVITSVPCQLEENVVSW